MSGMLNKLVSKIDGSSNRTNTTGSTTSATGTTAANRTMDGGNAGSAESEAVRQRAMGGTTGTTGSTGYTSSQGYTGTGPVGGTTGETERELEGETGTHHRHGRHHHNETEITGAHREGHEYGAREEMPETLDTTNVTHDAIHLGHKTHENVRHVEVEEVERLKEKERHIHHVQHHVQPIVDKEVRDEVQHERAIPQTEVYEKHVNEAGDREAYLALGAQHQDTLVHGEKERTVIDRGETVTENVQHHVHNVIQPIIEKETVVRDRVHTVIPVKHIIEEAPIVHESVAHEPISKEAFLAQGGQLGSGLTHENANVLAEGECERTVDGPAERLAEELGVAR